MYDLRSLQIPSVTSRISGLRVPEAGCLKISVYPQYHVIIIFPLKTCGNLMILVAAEMPLFFLLSGYCLALTYYRPPSPPLDQNQNGGSNFEESKALGKLACLKSVYVKLIIIIIFYSICIKMHIISISHHFSSHSLTHFFNTEGMTR